DATSISPLFLFFTATAPTQIYTLSLHDALPISSPGCPFSAENPKSPSRATSAAPRFTTPPAKESGAKSGPTTATSAGSRARGARSEEHTSELQSLRHLVCRLLLEKKKKK